MAGIIDLFIPREKKFLEYIDRQIILLLDCSEKLGKLLKDKKIDQKKLHKNLIYIQKRSDEADLICADITTSLQQTFITPIDREELKSLSISINFIVDSFEKIITSIYYFRLKKLDPNFLKQMKILKESVEILKLIFEEPLSQKRNKDHIKKVKELEREGDTIYRRAIGDLFNNGHNPIEIIKKKELYEISEDAIDDAKHIVDLLETVLINNA